MELKKKRGTKFNRLLGYLFYETMNRLSDTKHEENITTARLMTRRYVDSLVELREASGFASNLWSWTGFKQVPKKVTKLESSPTNYTLQKKFILFVKSVTTVSPKALIIFLGINALLSLFVLIFSAVWVVAGFLEGAPTPGWASLVLLTSGFFTLNSICLFLIGVYVSLTFDETRKRPPYVIRNKF